jgi:hypothetical protein
MTTFDERERAFEQMFVHDADMRFRALSRRNKMVALWAARQIGLEAVAAETYARDVVNAVVAEDGDQRVLQKIASDLRRVSSYWTEGRLRDVMAEFMSKAVTQVRTEAG